MNDFLMKRKAVRLPANLIEKLSLYRHRLKQSEGTIIRRALENYFEGLK